MFLYSWFNIDFIKEKKKKKRVNSTIVIKFLLSVSIDVLKIGFLFFIFAFMSINPK